MTCLEVVDGGSSSSHGHTDTDTAVFSAVGSSQGHTEQDAPGAKFESTFSVGSFAPSLFHKNEK